jgi:hypothetical protein
MFFSTLRSTPDSVVETWVALGSGVGEDAGMSLSGMSKAVG